MRRVRCLLILALLVITTACQVPLDGSAERLDAVVEVRPDGAVDVREELTMRFATGATSFTRRIHVERADGLEWLRASLDGRDLQPGAAGAAEVTVADGARLTVTWTFPATAGSSRTFGLAYRVRGAVAVRGQRGTLRQVVVASARPHPIGASRVRLVVPDGIHVFEGTAGMAEAGWSVVRTPDGIDAARPGVGPEEGATVMAEISVDPAVVAEPLWQRHEEWTRQLIPAFLAGGLFILVIGAGILWIVRFQYPRRGPGLIAGNDDERERQVVRTGLRTSGRAAVVLAVALAGVTWVTLGHFGVWPLALPLAIFVVGLVFVALGPRYV